MADDVDIANEELEKQLEETLKTFNTEIPTNDTNKCIWCGGPIQERDNRRWCSVECRNDQEIHAKKV